PVAQLVAAMGAALEFDDPEDPQSVDMQRLLREQDADAFTAAVTGLDPSHPLYARVREVVAARQATLTA
ncbi:MAG: mannitol-1-phosphate 5-dehydrogenase, partial [Microbacterium sp.]|nr:mannitol-1-phosphate 5-dehydrogenase [Microbacterium sp.]